MGLAFWGVVAVTCAWRGALATLAPYAAVLAAGTAVCLLLRHRRLAASWADWLPLPLVILTYEMLHAVVPACWEATVDDALRDIDAGLFGSDVAALLGSFPPPLVAAALGLCYATYYVLPVALAARWWRRDRRAFRELMAGEVGGLFLGYLGYLFLPATGPHAFLSAAEGGGGVPGDFVGAAIRSLNANHGGAFPRDAFPSLHTCNVVTAVLVALRHERRALRWLLPIGGSIVAATVLLRWHWVVDVAAGAALAVLWQPLARRFVARESRDVQSRTRPPPADETAA